MKQKDKERWEKAQFKGKLKFILVNWVLLRAMPAGACAIFFSKCFFIGYDYFFDYSSFQITRSLSIPAIGFELLCWIIIGCILGWSDWDKLEKEFSQNTLEK